MRGLTETVLGGLILLTAPLAAQTTDHNQRVVDALYVRGRYQGPLCGLPGGDFHSSSAGTYLKTAVEGIEDDNKGGGRSTVDFKKYTDIVEKAVTSAIGAVQNNPKNAAGWYYLGRADLQLGDLHGADSSFQRLLALAPSCDADVKSLRQRAWVALVTPSTDFMGKAQDTTLTPDQRQAWSDSALDILRDANLAAQYYPQAFYNLAGTFTIRHQYDSAIVYYKMALDKSGTDPQFAKMTQTGQFNLAHLYQAQHDTTDAITMYQKYVASNPNDNDAKRSLAALLRLSGHADEAGKIEGELMSSGAMTAPELVATGVRAFRDSNYAAAADAFQKALTLEPNNHDAMYDLANAYYAEKDGVKLQDAAQKLLAVEPMSQNNFKLLVNAYRLQNNQDQQIAVMTSFLALPTTLQVDSFRVANGGAKLYGQGIGMESADAAGKTIAPAPVTVTFEFLNAQGAVVGSQDATLPALKPHDTAPFSAVVTGDGIVAWRYHKKT